MSLAPTFFKKNFATTDSVRGRSNPTTPAKPKPKVQKWHVIDKNHLKLNFQHILFSNINEKPRFDRFFYLWSCYFEPYLAGEMEIFWANLGGSGAKKFVKTWFLVDVN